MGSKKRIRRENRARKSIHTAPLPLIQNTRVNANAMLDTPNTFARFMHNELFVKNIGPNTEMLQALFQLTKWLKECAEETDRFPYFTNSPCTFLQRHMEIFAGEGQVVFLPSALIPLPRNFTVDDTRELLNAAFMLWTHYFKATQKPPTIRTFLCDFLFCVMIGELELTARTPSHLHVLSIKDQSFSKRMITRMLTSTECAVCLEVSQTRPMRCSQCDNHVCQRCFSDRQVTSCPVCRGHERLQRAEHVVTLPVSGHQVVRSQNQELVETLQMAIQSLRLS
jgi:hypothetical protein